MRWDGIGYIKISLELGLSENTVTPYISVTATPIDQHNSSISLSLITM